ncbi:MAG: menaquinone biosynthesis protein [Bacteroidales bacterium]|jgi:chorismate dehydratase|nr:menaquinone biosynthesis protein [Bacteroidales bacterium]
MINISLVSYLNSYPYHYGLINETNSFYNKLDIVNPAQCAKNFQEGISNVALVPVGALHGLKNYKIIKPFCISANGEVRSVFLFSQKPVEDTKTIVFDSDSRSSNLLIQVLCKYYWKINPNFTKNNNSLQAEARIGIGDKAFKLKKKYAYSYDLSIFWKEMTNLPFVFAVWITKSEIAEEELSLLKIALENGINNIHGAVVHFGSAGLTEEDAIKYLSKNINFKMNTASEKGMQRFLELSKNFI